MAKIKVLISAAGGAGTIAVINSLKATGRYWVAAVDSDRYAAGLYLADYGEVLPLVLDKNYFKRISALIKKFAIDAYIPLIDEEIINLKKLKNVNPKLKIILPKPEFSALVLDKLKMVRAFEAAGITCPRTYLYEELTKKSFERKLFVKPIVGRGSRGIAVINSPKELAAYFSSKQYRRSEVIIQEYIGGEEYTVSAVVGKGTRLYAVVPKRIIKKKGITYLSVTERNPLIDKLVARICAAFAPQGPFNVQLKIFKGKAYVIEVNPRFSTTVAQTIAAGINEVDLVVRDFLGVRAAAGKVGFKDKLVMVRYLTQSFVDEGRLL